MNYYVPKSLKNIKTVCTIHDLSAFKYPETLPKNYLYYITKAINNSISRVSMIITTSETIRYELLNRYEYLNEEKVTVCGSGVRSIFYDNIKLLRDDISYSDLINNNYYLCVGTLEKRKNINFLLNTFIKAQNEGQINQQTKLVLVGKCGFGYDEFQHLLYHKNILWLTYIKDEELVRLYKFSKALIMPSFYEGFGTPIPEAMVTNTAIIAASIPTNFEFNRKHNHQILIFDNGNESSLIEVLSYVDKNEDLRYKLNYGDVSIYSYDKVAQKHLNLYNSILAR